MMPLSLKNAAPKPPARTQRRLEHYSHSDVRFGVAPGSTPVEDEGVREAPSIPATFAFGSPGATGAATTLSRHHHVLRSSGGAQAAATPPQSTASTTSRDAGRHLAMGLMARTTSTTDFVAVPG
jgi:hypothetical protein